MGVPAPHATRIQPCSAMAGRDAALAHTIGSTLAADHNSCRHFNLVEERGETFRHRFLDGGILRPQLLPDCQKAFPSRQPSRSRRSDARIRPSLSSIEDGPI